MVHVSPHEEASIMTPLRQRMIEDMQVRNLSPHTIEYYVRQVALFARYFNRSPELLGRDEIRAYQLHLVQERNLGWGSINQAVCALRFLYRKTLGKDWDIDSIPFAKQPKKLPLVLSQDQVRAVLDAITNPQHRVIAMTLYAAGLRVSEAVSLRITDIDSQRMLLHVVQGKGRKDRLVTLAPLLLHHLRCHYRRYRPRHWLFPSTTYPDRHVTRDAVAQAITKVRHVVAGKPVSPHTLRHCPKCRRSSAPSGWNSAAKICCRSPISTPSSPCRRNWRRWRSRTNAKSRDLSTPYTQ